MVSREISCKTRKFINLPLNTLGYYLGGYNFLSSIIKDFLANVMLLGKKKKMQIVKRNVVS